MAAAPSGFLRPSPYSALLPYSDGPALEEEANALLADVLDGIYAAVRLSELAPGLLFWLRQLNEYAPHGATRRLAAALRH